MKSKKIISYLAIGLLGTSGAFSVIACETNSNSSVPDNNIISPLNALVASLSTSDFRDLAFNYDEEVESKTNMAVDSEAFLKAIFGLSKFQALDPQTRTSLKLEDITVRRDKAAGRIRFYIQNHSLTNQPKILNFSGFTKPTDFDDLNGEIELLDTEDFNFSFYKDELPSAPANLAFTEYKAFEMIKGLSQFENLKLLPQLTIQNISIDRDDEAGSITLKIKKIDKGNDVKEIIFDGFYSTADENLKNGLKAISDETLAGKLGLNGDPNTKPGELETKPTAETVATALNELFPEGTDASITSTNVPEITFDDGTGTIIIKVVLGDFFEIKYQIGGYKADSTTETLNAAIASLAINPNQIWDNSFFDKSKPTNEDPNKKTSADFLARIKSLDAFKNIDAVILDKFEEKDIAITADQYTGRIDLTISNHGENLNLSFTGFKEVANKPALETFVKDLTGEKMRETLGWETDRLPSANDTNPTVLINKIKNSPELYEFSTVTTDLLTPEMLKITAVDESGGLTIQIFDPEDTTKLWNWFSYKCRKALYADDLLNPDFWDISTSGVSRKEYSYVSKGNTETESFADELITHDGENYYTYHTDIYHFQNDQASQIFKNDKVDSEAYVTIMYEVNWWNWLESQGMTVDEKSNPEYRIIVYYTKKDNTNVAYFLDTKKSGGKLEYEFSEASFASESVFNIQYDFATVEKGSLFQSEKGNIWLGTYSTEGNDDSGQLLKLTKPDDGTNDAGKWVKNDKFETEYPNFRITGNFFEATEKDGSKTIYISMEDYSNEGSSSKTNPVSGFYTLDEETDEIEPALLNVASWNAVITQDADGNVFFTTWREGLYVRAADDPENFEKVYYKDGKTIAEVRGSGFMHLSGDRLLIPGFAKNAGILEIKRDDENSPFYVENVMKEAFWDQWSRFLKTTENGMERYYLVKVTSGLILRILLPPPNAKYQYAVNEGDYQDTAPTSLASGDTVHIRIVPKENAANYEVVFSDESLSELSYTVK